MSACLTHSRTAVSVRSKSTATWPIDRSPRRHNSPISALNSEVNDRRGRTLFFSTVLAALTGRKSQASTLTLSIRPRGRHRSWIPSKPAWRCRSVYPSARRPCPAQQRSCCLPGGVCVRPAVRHAPAVLEAAEGDVTEDPHGVLWSHGFLSSSDERLIQGVDAGERSPE